MGDDNGSSLVSNISTSACARLLIPSLTGPTPALLFKEVATPIILLFGIVGNLLSFIVMSSRILRRKSYSQYLCALALFDSFNLVDREIRAVEELLESLGRPRLLQGLSTGGCKLHRFIQHVCVSMSSWIIVLMAVERFVVIFFPFRRHVICTPGRSVLAIMCALGLICLSQVFTLVMTKYSDLAERCTPHAQFNLIYTELYTYFYLLCLILLFPTAIIVVCNLAVVLKISKYKRLREVIRSSDRSDQFISRQGLKTTVMLLTISSVYVLTFLPSVLSMFIIQVSIIEEKPTEETCGKLLAFQPYGHVLEVLSSINYGVNFYIYVLSGKAFRFELQKILRRDSSTASTRIRNDIEGL
ncbi:FMRFamide peptide receptor frpr-18-like [Liolophura sinensis]|uniref:FMRFamide peptide receptor frpr-18-like n=1 Tax=Liolophura sinensis TaxID=3198878 RepID=UPI003158E87B